jgi:hypothetical protein
MMSWRLPLVACVLAAACGSDPDSSGPAQGPGSVINISGGERIMWDQPTDSPISAQAYTYTLYISGMRAALTEVECANVRTAGGVECSGRLPSSMARGVHTLELTASANGVESGRSVALRVSVGSLAVLGHALTLSDTGAPPAPGEPAIVCGAPQDCYERRRLATLAGDVTSPVASGDRVFLIEDGVRVRAALGDVLLEEPALAIGGDARIRTLVLPPDYERSRAVFVAWTEPGQPGLESLNITRYRELQGAFGEGATIVVGLPIPAGAPVPMAVDDRGLLYVALPGTGSGSAVLRFTPDGSVPGENPRLSPIVAHGYERPSSLAWDAVSRELWLAGSDPRWQGHVSRLPVEADGRSRWPWLPSLAPSPDTDMTDVALALTSGPPPHHARHIWLVHEDGSVERAVLPPPGQALRFQSFDVNPGEPVVAIANDPSRGVLVVIGAAPGSAGTESVLWRLAPLPGP